MKKTACAIIFILIFSFKPMHCQKIMYGGMQQFGLVFGQSKTNFSFHMINGIRFKRFFAGVGADAEYGHRKTYSYYSYYGTNSLNTSAVFADVRYYFNKKKNFFILTDLGVNYITENFSSGEYDKYKKRPGYYACIGLGFKARIGKEIFYSFDVNYCIQQARYDYSYRNYIPVREQTDKYDLRKNCLLVRMGVEIF